MSTDQKLTFDEGPGAENGQPETLDPNMALPSGDNSIDVTLPSRLSGRMRRWKPSDLRFLSDRQQLARPGPVVNATILKLTWLETYSTGPYTFTGMPPWMTDILVGDLTDAVRQGRMFMWGNSYEVDFVCESQRCASRIPYDQDLSKIEVVELSPEALDRFAHGNRFEFTLPDCGRRIVHKLPTGAVQIHADKLVKQHGLIEEVAWASRTRSIEGVSSPGQFVKFYGDLSADDIRAMDEEFERHDCGLRTRVDLVCPAIGCGLEQEQELRFGGFFYRPQKGRRDLLG